MITILVQTVFSDSQMRNVRTQTISLAESIENTVLKEIISDLDFNINFMPHVETIKSPQDQQ